jgi:hypothetical protein
VIRQPGADTVFTWLRSLFSASAIIELDSRRIGVRDLSGDTRFEFEPLLSLDASSKVVSIGRPIPASAVKTHAPLSNWAASDEQRLITELLLQYAFSKLSAISWVKPAPKIVLVVPDDTANAARRLDDATLEDLAAGAGARVTVIRRGAPVSLEEARRLLDAG